MRERFKALYIATFLGSDIFFSLLDSDPIFFVSFVLGLAYWGWVCV
jgi:hypothetical protein